MTAIRVWLFFYDIMIQNCIGLQISGRINDDELQ